MNPTEKKNKMVDHRHHFKVRFDANNKKYIVYCTEPCTVLGVIKSHLSKQFGEEIKKSEEKIIIRVGKGNDSPIVATHFPCSCVDEGECLTITTSKEVVQKKQEEPTVLPKENYSVFFIDKKGGENTKTKTDKIFRCTNVTVQFKYFGVYATKGMTVEEALRQDGRFDDRLTDFTLSDNKTGDLTNCTAIVDNLDGREFQICLPMEKKASKFETIKVLEHAAQKGINIKKAMEELGFKIDLDEINELLQQQNPKLKEWVGNRFPDGFFEEALKLKQENFGKIQHSFSEVHRVRELVNLSESICLLKIKETNPQKTVKGTGFVLVDKFILTNAHLFKSWEEIKNWWEYLNITAEFENPDGKSKKTFQAKWILGSHDSDLVLLELIQSPDQTETEKISPGLLKKFGPVPGADGDGGACIIGHPAGGVKKMDVTCVIRKEDREQAVSQNLDSYKDYLFTICSANYQVKRDPYADIHVTYNSFMYHGSSGSPVFDASGRVFGLHSGGFFFEEAILGHSVIEYCYPLLDVFKKLLEELQKNGRWDILNRVMKEAQGIECLEEIIESWRGVTFDPKFPTIDLSNCGDWYCGYDGAVTPIPGCGY